MKLPCFSLFCQKLIANSQKRLLFFFSPAPQLLCSLALLFFCLPAFSQQTWQRTYGGTGSDYGWSVQQTTDGGYIVAGFTDSFGHGGYDVYLIKTNASGDTLWTRTYGGTGDDYGYSVRQTTDGGYIITGYTTSYGRGHADVYLIKTNASGDTLWTRTYGGVGYSFGESVQETSDSGYIIVGYTNSIDTTGTWDVYLIKVNPSGDTLWSKTYGDGTIAHDGYSVQQTRDGGYIVAGLLNTSGGQVYLMKTDASGDSLWTRTYGGGGDFGYCVRQTSDSGYIISGEFYSHGYGSKVYLIKTNFQGDTLWTRTYGEWSTWDVWGYSVQQTTDGGYIVAGRTGSPSFFQLYLVKTNPQGDTLWTRTYGGTRNNEGYSVHQTTDGGYIIAGYTNSFGAGAYDVYLIKTDANGNVGVEDKAVLSPVFRFPSSVRPNPFTSFATIPGHSSERFALYDVSGRKVGTYKGDRVGEGLSAGVYFLRADNKDSKLLRIVKLR